MGSLLMFPRIPRYKWSPMDYHIIEQSMQKLLVEAEAFHASANELPLKVRAKLFKKMQVSAVDDDYLPWGGLFPHPRVRKEGF